MEQMTPSSEKIRRRRKDSESEGKEGEFGYGAHLTRKSGEGREAREREGNLALKKRRWGRKRSRVGQ